MPVSVPPLQPPVRPGLRRWVPGCSGPRSAMSRQAEHGAGVAARGTSDACLRSGCENSRACATGRGRARAAAAIFSEARAYFGGEDGINRKERKERREELGWQEGVGGVLAIPRRVIPAQFSLRSLRSLRLNQRGNRKALTTKNAKNAERNLVQFSLRSLYSLRLNQQ